MRNQFTNPGSSAAPRGERNSRINMRSGLLALLCSMILAIGLTACPSHNHTVVSSSPNITSLNPNAGAVAAPVTIAGTNFGTTQGNSTVAFNGTTATPTSWSATSIAAPVSYTHLDVYKRQGLNTLATFTVNDSASRKKHTR